jgi:hypothetical protein
VGDELLGFLEAKSRDGAILDGHRFASAMDCHSFASANPTLLFL